MRRKPAPVQRARNTLPRQEYTMTPEQFVAMGGTEPPEGYDPDAWKPWQVGRDAVAPVGKEPEGTAGTHIMYRNPTAGHPAHAAEVATLQELGEYHGVAWLTIHWPDWHSPDFTARPLEETR